MTFKKRHQDGFTHRQILQFGLSFLLIGSVLFLFVWWPIQAERANRQLKTWESQLAQKKAELNQLKSRYAHLTALSELDQWASLHGPWRTPQANDVLLLPS